MIFVKYDRPILGPYSSIPPFYGNLYDKKKESSGEKKELKAIKRQKPQTL
jgi:hypothetical protein